MDHIMYWFHYLYYKIKNYFASTFYVVDHNGDIWTDKEIAELHHLTTLGFDDIEIAKILRRTQSSVYQKRRRLHKVEE